MIVRRPDVVFSSRARALIAGLVLGLFSTLPAAAQPPTIDGYQFMRYREYMPGVEWPEPPKVTPGAAGAPPSDAIVLFDGTDLEAWEGSRRWKVEYGMMIVGRGDIRTKQSFGDCQLHIEWSAPTEVVGDGQGRGNSGIFLMGEYEIQVLDSYNNKTYYDGQAGAIYKQTPPMTNAMRPPGEWNVYDIIWTAPRFAADGSLTSPAYMTATHNGVLILNHFKLLGDTQWSVPPAFPYAKDGKGPIRLQDHGNPVRYRNIWVRELTPVVGRQVREPYFHDHDSGSEWLMSEGPTPPGWKERQNGGDEGDSTSENE